MEIIESRSIATLVCDDYFSYRGERARFIRWIGATRQTRFGPFRTAEVQTPDGSVDQWSIDQLVTMYR